MASMHRYAGKYLKAQPNGVVTHGFTEPILSVLDARGFEIKDLVVFGFNRDCGSLVFDTQERAYEAKNALEPAYAVTVKQNCNGDWDASYDRREMDGTVPSWLITNIVMKDGRQVMKDGRWVR